MASDMTFIEGSIVAFATLLVYLDAALASNVNHSGQLLVLVLLIGSAGLLAIANEKTEMLHMHGHVIKVNGPRRQYNRRLEMAEQLIKESGREDWAIRMGMIHPKTDDGRKAKSEGKVII